MAFAALTIDINAKLANLETGLKRAETQLQGFASKAEAIGSGLSVAFGAVAGAFTIDAVVGQIAAAVNELAALDDAAEQSGASVEELSSLLNTLAPTGVTIEQIADVTGKLARAMREASDETSAQAQAFAALGVSAKDADGNYKSTAATLQEVATALAQFEDGTNKTILAQALLGKTGAANLPMLKDLATRTLEASTVTSEQAAEAERLSNAWRALKRDGELFAQSIAVAIIPSLADLIEQFRVAGRAGGSFGDQLRAALGPNKALADRQADLAGLEEQRRVAKQLGLSDEALADYDARIARAKRSIEGLQAAVRIANGPGQDQIDGVTPSASPQRLRAAPVLAGSVERAAKATREQATEAERLLDALQRQIDSQQKLNAVDETGLAIRRGLAGLTPEIGRELLLRAQQIDRIKAENTAREELKKTIDALAESEAKERAALESALAPYSPRIIEEANRILQSLPAAQQRFQAELTRFFDERFIDGLIPESEWQEAIRRINGLSDEIAKAGEATGNKLDLALAPIESAFEKIILEGGNAREVIGALGEDIAKLLLRSQITKPLADLFGALLSGGSTAGVGKGTIIGELFGFITGRATGGPVSANQPYWVGERGVPELFVPETAGRVVPMERMSSGVSVVNNITVSGGASRADVLAAVNEATTRTKQDILSSMRRGGAFAS